MQHSGRFSIKSDQLIVNYLDSLKLSDPKCMTLHLKTRSKLIADLHELWCQFACSVVLDSAAKKPVTANGVRLKRVVGCRSRRAVMKVLHERRRSVNDHTAFGIKFNSNADVIKATNILACDNARTIAAALGSHRARSLHELNVVRNWVIHNNRTAAIAYTKLTRRRHQRSRIHRDTYMRENAPLSWRFETWARDLQFVSIAMVQ